MDWYVAERVEKEEKSAFIPDLRSLSPVSYHGLIRLMRCNLLDVQAKFPLREASHPRSP
jgi:hypothetical protein